MFIFTIIIIFVFIWAVFVYNKLTYLTNLVYEARSDIDVQLKRRYELIPNLVSVVKGYVKHEKDIFEKIAKIRSDAIKSGTLLEKSKTNNALAESLKTVFALSENYPSLKSNENFLELQKELSKIEDKIQFARRFYNGGVRDLNTKIQSFPSNIVSLLFSFKKADFFDLKRIDVFGKTKYFTKKHDNV